MPPRRTWSDYNQPSITPRALPNDPSKIPSQLLPTSEHQTSPDTPGSHHILFVGSDLYVYLLPVYYCMCLRSGGIDSIGITMDWDRFSQPTGLRFIPGGGIRVPRKEPAFPGPASETDGSQPVSNQAGDAED